MLILGLQTIDIVRDDSNVTVASVQLENYAMPSFQIYARIDPAILLVKKQYTTPYGHSVVHGMKN